MASNQVQTSRKITEGGKDYLKHVIELYPHVFRNDPVFTYMLCSLDETARLAYLPSFFRSICTAAALNRASFDEIDNFACIGVMMPPGERVNAPWTLIPAGLPSVLWNLGISGCWRMLVEFGRKGDSAKRKVLKKNEKYYYLFSVGTREDRQKQGLCSDLIRYYQDIARRTNFPIWLEATTASSRELYQKLGFEVSEEIVLGQGKAGPDGKQCRRGEGVRAWGMLWRPEGEKTSGKLEAS